MTEPLSDVPDRVFERILRNYTVNESGCYIPDLKPYKTGYVTAAWREHGVKHRVRVHRLSYYRATGHDPGDLEIDHVCHDPHQCHSVATGCPHRACFNPEHLRVATSRENTLRSNAIPAIHAAKPVCPKCGGPWSARPTGGRECKPCKARANHERYIQRVRPALLRPVVGVSEVQELHAQGLSIHSISERLGIDRKTVRKRLRGIEPVFYSRSVAQ